MDYQNFSEQFLQNLKVMSRTVNGVLDVSASAGKSDSMATLDANAAARMAQDNIEEALSMIYESRYRIFPDEQKLGEYIIKIAETVNTGIVKPGMLFRNGSDSKKYPYAKIEHLDELWDWFCHELFVRMTTPANDSIVIAAFAEYYINRAAHFFSDGCGKISMLVSSFILVRNDMELPKYISRDDYYSHAETKVAVTPEQPIDMEKFTEFTEYYRSLFRKQILRFSIEESTEAANCTAVIKGNFDEDSVIYFEKEMERLFAEHPGEEIILNAKYLNYISGIAVQEIRKLSEKYGKILLDELDQTCYMALYLAGMEENVLRHHRVPSIDVSGCEILGEGANGVVYRYGDDLVVKVFKQDSDVDEILYENNLSHQAFNAGVPCPISFGIAFSDGKIALLYELMNPVSFIKLVREDSSNIEKYMGEFVNLVKQMHSVRGDALLPFPKNALMKEVLGKADKLDKEMGEEYYGKLRKEIESIREPEGLLHGDIQPSNIVFSRDGIGVIDLDTISTGCPIMEIGNFRRTLHADWELSGGNESGFLKIPSDVCVEMWESFIKKYYEGVDEKTVRSKLRTAEIISDILVLAKKLKHNNKDAAFENGIRRLKELIDEK